jgi:hypothetical protein
MLFGVLPSRANRRCTRRAARPIVVIAAPIWRGSRVSANPSSRAQEKNNPSRFARQEGLDRRFAVISMLASHMNV